MVAISRRRQVVVPAVTAAAALTLTGCLVNPEAGSSQGGFGQGMEPEEGDGTVTILGNFGGAEEEGFNASLEEFTEETGINVQYVSDADFATTIQLRVNSGEAPDIGLFPQPGGIMQLVAQGDIVPIDEFLDYDALSSTLIPGQLDSARFQGRVYAVPMRMSVKSLVWYPRPAFEENGWDTEPANLSELDALADQIKEDTGAAPWCIGFESSQATGWVGTDWVEEYMLRLHGPEVYDDWMYGRIPFDDPRVVEAFEAYGELSKAEGNVLGGTTGIVSTPFAEAMTPAFQDDPDCFLMRQGNFVTGFFPSDVQENLDEEVGIFVFPPAEDGWDGQPILGAGDLAAAFTYDTDTVALMEFLTSDEFGGAWAELGGWLSPHRTFDTSLYPDETTRQMAEIANEADVFRFDASDVMPSRVGSDSFWRGMVEFQDGSKSAEQVTEEIWATWPEELRGGAVDEEMGGR